MKLKTVINLFAAACLLSSAANTIAAGSNNPETKPKCPPGQVAKLVNGLWQCKPLTVNAAGDTERSQAAPTRSKPVVPTTPVTPQRVQAKKPDLLIMHASRVGGQAEKYAVQVKNNGQVTSPDVQLFGTKKAAGNNAVNAAANVPKIKAGEFTWVYITFQNLRFAKGDRIEFFVDGLNQANESNENNNKKYINHQ